MYHATVTQIENCAVWNNQEAELSERKAKDASLSKNERGYWERRAARLDMQAFRLFRRAHEMKSFKRAA